MENSPKGLQNGKTDFLAFLKRSCKKFVVMNNKAKLLSLFIKRFGFVIDDYPLFLPIPSSQIYYHTRQNRFVVFLHGDKKHFRVNMSINLIFPFLVLFVFKVLWHHFDMGRLDVHDLHDPLHSAGISRQLDFR